MGCPMKMRPNDARGCCYWRDFEADFLWYWPRYFAVEPSIDEWIAARRDWIAGNTGYEAVMNVRARAKDRDEARQISKMIAAGAIKVARRNQ